MWKLLNSAACILAASQSAPVRAYTTISDARVAASLWRSGNFTVLVDVRRKDEWDAGHLPNATFVELLHETRDASRLAGCEDCAIAVYCTVGYRSKRAARVLDEKGFTNVYDVLGINQWMDAGVDLVTDKRTDPTCCGCGAACDATTILAGAGALKSFAAILISVVGLVPAFIS
ncbi:hypothetical protein ACHAWF_006833 [Thalassiosira exigua]